MINKNILVFSAFLLSVFQVTATSTDADNPFKTIRVSNTLPKELCDKVSEMLTKTVQPLKDAGKFCSISDAEIEKLLKAPEGFAAQTPLRAQALAAFWFKKMEAARGTDSQKLRATLESLSNKQSWYGSINCVDRLDRRESGGLLPYYNKALGEFYHWIWESLPSHDQADSCMVTYFSFSSPVSGQTAQDWFLALAPVLSEAGQKIIAGLAVDMTGLFTIENLTPYHVSKQFWPVSCFDTTPAEDDKIKERREVLAKILAAAYYVGDKSLGERGVQVLTSLIEQYIAKGGTVKKSGDAYEVPASPESAAVLPIFPGGKGILSFDSSSKSLSFL